MCGTLYDFFKDQGSMIAGILALIAAGITVLFTKVMADRTIRATRETANREIAAAQEQVRVAQDQIATTRQMEQQRIIREKLGFCGSLVAAMERVLSDAPAARELAESAAGQQFSLIAYEARQQIRQNLFPELRNACVRIGDNLAARFLHLDAKIDSFSRQWKIDRHPQGSEFRVGEYAGMIEEISQIEDEATSLRDYAKIEAIRCVDNLELATLPG
jgi:hypothetical protein